MRWIAVSIIPGLIVTCYIACFAAFPDHYFVLSLIGIFLIVFVYMVSRDPKYRYIRFASWLATSWLATTSLPRIRIAFEGYGSNKANIEIDDSMSWPVHLVFGFGIIVCLILDFLGSREYSALGKFFDMVHIRFGSQRQIVSSGSGIQIRDISGQSNVTINQTDLHHELDIANSFLELDNPKAAINYLERLENTHGASMSQQQKFLLNKYYGRAYYAMSELPKSSIRYRKAASLRAGDQEGQECDLMGILLECRNEEAYEKATNMVSVFPDSGLAAAIMIIAAPENLEIDAILERISTAVENDRYVLEALANRYLKEDKADHAERYARAALEKKPTNPILKGLVAETIVAGETKSSVKYIVNGLQLPDTTINRLNEAVSLLSEAISRSSSQQRTCAFRLARGAANELLGKITEAEADFVEAKKADSTDKYTVIRYAEFLGRQRRFAESVEVLRTFAKSVDDIEVLSTFGFLVLESGDNSDKDNAISCIKSHLSRYRELSSDHEFLTFRTLVHLVADREGASSAMKVLDEFGTSFVPSYIASIVKAEITRNTADTSKTNEAVSQAIKAIPADASAQWRFCLSVVLKELNRHKDRLDVLRPVAHPIYFGLLGIDALESAHLCEDAEFILDYTQLIRKSGIWDPYSIQLEVEYLRRYREYDKAIEICINFIDASPNENVRRNMRLRLSQLAIISGQRQFLITDPKLLPKVDELASGDILVFCGVIEEGPDRMRAVEIAYDLVRRNFASYEAHMALCHAVGFGTPKPISIKDPGTVTPGTAVRIRLNGSSTQQWIILEDCDNPNQTIDEYSATHPLVKELLGKKVGDTFEKLTNPLNTRKGTVEEIISKYHYRVRDTLSRWNDMFPEVSFVYPVELQIDEDKHVDYTPVLRKFERDSQNDIECRQIYQSNPMSILMFANWRNQHPMDVIHYLSCFPELPIRCCTGNTQDFDQGRAALNSESLVVDPTALSIVFLTDLWKKIDCLPFHLIVTRSAIEQFENVALLQKHGSDEFFAHNDGQVVRISVPPESRTQFIKRIEEFCDWIKRHTDVRSGIALARMSIDLREQLISFFGEAAADSFAIAMQEDVPIWTDDITVPVILREYQPIRRTWTQLVAERLHHDKLLSDAEFTDFLIFLLSSGYTHTQCTPHAIARAAELSKWDPKTPPFNSILTWIEDDNIQSIGLVVIILAGLKLIWRNTALIHQRDSVTFSIGRAVVKRSSGKETLKSMISLLDRVFTVEPNNADQCRIILLKAFDNASQFRTWTTDYR